MAVGPDDLSVMVVKCSDAYCGYGFQIMALPHTRFQAYAAPLEVVVLEVEEDAFDWGAMAKPAAATQDSGLRCVLIFTAAIISAGMWPQGGMNVIKTFLVALLLDKMGSAGGALRTLAGLVETVHATADTSIGVPGTHPIRLSIGFKYGAAILEGLPYVLTSFPMFLRTPAASYAGVVEGASSTPMYVRVSLSMAPNMWLSKHVQELYAAIRISGVNFLVADVVKYILETYNNHKHVYGKLLDIDFDRSQACVFGSKVLPGNDYVAIVTDCKFTGSIVVHAPIRTIMRNYGAIVQSLPEIKNITFTRQPAVPAAHWRKGYGQHDSRADKEDESVHRSKRSKLHHVSAATGVLQQVVGPTPVPAAHSQA